MKGSRHTSAGLDVPERQAAAFRRALRALDAAHVPCSVGGGFALYQYAGVRRQVKDLDVHVLPDDVDVALRALDKAGFSTRVKHWQWLAQASCDEALVDLIFGHANWLAPVDRGWIERGEPGEVMGYPVRFTPPEEIIWSKAFRCNRERYDGADVFHVLLGVGERLDWRRLLARFGEHWPVLLSHLVLFRYTYPSEAAVIPDDVLDDLLDRLERDRRTPWTGGKLCRGPLLDGAGSYAQDVTEWGFRDARQEIWERRLREERLVTPRSAARER